MAEAVVDPAVLGPELGQREDEREKGAMVSRSRKILDHD